ncbi:hypothetical protein [uncultured Cohaesibacter sp.]|uniref:hypothetical protein n=1 Tax=uncultured Cohaesibacter sp. TaxID=1002546 RepID=UPI0029C73460|nr:hypothetical protein [uncultured Cohaesibacter sp.]
MTNYSDQGRALGVVCLSLLAVVAGVVPAAADWSLNEGRANLGSYVDGTVESGNVTLSMHCRQQNAHMGTQINLVRLPMPQAAKVSDAETTFTLVFELGGGVTYKLPVKSHYVDFEDTWVGANHFDMSQFDALGGSKQIIVLRADGSEAKRFSSGGTRKLEQAMRKRCFPNIR